MVEQVADQIQPADPLVERTKMGEKFVVDVVPSSLPMVYVTLQREPKIVLFGGDIELRQPVFASIWEDRLMVSAEETDPGMRVFYRDYRGGESSIGQIRPSMMELLRFLSHRTTPEEPAPGLDLSYAEVVGALSGLLRKGIAPAQFVPESDKLQLELVRLRQTESGEERPEFEGDLPDDPDVRSTLHVYFPEVLQERFPVEIERLKSGINAAVAAVEKLPPPSLETLFTDVYAKVPAHLREQIRQHGIRNSHLLSIAPTGTISLAFADNASNGIEPAFSWSYQRKKRMPDGSTKEYAVEDHAWRLYRHLKGEQATLTPAFITALELSATDHVAMVAAVAPCIDTAISKTVNVPADYPYADFKDLYLQAWRAGIKGLATFRPNPVTGAVLSVQSAPAPTLPTSDGDDPLRRQFDSRPPGDLEGVTSKVEYCTSEGKKSVYLTINFMRVAGTVDGRQVVIERPVEFFMPAGQRDEGQQWIASNMRMLSMVGRSGGSIEKALQNMREVVWDKGPVQCGVVLRGDGHTARRWHDSEVAAIGYWLQQMLAKRGFLDADGHQVPVLEMSARLSRQLELQLGGDDDSVAIDRHDTQPATTSFVTRGRQCPECGARALRRVDGCERCTECNHVGSCG